MSGARALTLVETAAAAASLAPGTDEVLALSPWAEIELERRGIPFTRTSDHLDRRQREDLGQATFGLCDRLVAMLDEALVAEAPDLAGSHFRPAFASYFWLKVALDAVMLRVAELDAAVRNLRPMRVRYHPMPAPQGQPAGLRFAEEPLYSRLIPAIAEARGVATEALAAEPWPFVRIPASPGKGSLALGRLAEIAALKPLPRRRTGATVLGLDTCLARRLVPESPHRLLIWKPGAAAYLDLGGMPRPRKAPAASPTGVAAAGERAWERVASQSELAALLSCREVDCRPLLTGRLQQLLARDASALMDVYQSAGELIRRRQVDAVLARTFAEADRRVVAQAARAAGVTVVAYDHGAMGYFNFPMDRYLDSAVADVRLVWGEGVRRQVERRYPEGARAVAVGGEQLDPLIGQKDTDRERRRRRLRRQLHLDPDRTVVLFAVTKLSGNDHYISHRSATDAECCARQRAILRALAARPQIQVVLKLHPTAGPPGDPLAEFVRECGPRECAIVKQPALSEVLDVADIFINDSPTTTLLQMLTTCMPVLVLDNGGLELEPEAVEPLRRRAVLANTPEELLAALDALLAGESRADTADTTFLRLYGTHRGDGQSGRRALEALSAELTSERP